MAADGGRADRDGVPDPGRSALELHDVLAHAVTVMVVQAAGARRVIDVDPEQARAALAEIEVVGKQAMLELRRFADLFDATLFDATLFEEDP
jgi:signal transduction histidine kinase